MMRWVTAVGVLAAVAPGCGDDAKVPVGGVCTGDAACAHGLCYSGACLDPAGDDDADTLLNGVEVVLGTDPFDDDSDGDGASDPDELNSDLTARDSDGDGKADAIESLSADADQDCIPDQEDADDAVAAAPTEALLQEHCLLAGVCDAGRAAIGITCGSEVVCDYAAVSGWEADEATCDGVDNDCDGQTDEAAPTDAQLQAHCLVVGACAADKAAITLSCGDTVTCDYASVSDWEAEETACDGVDNDCDGQTDEPEACQPTCSLSAEDGLVDDATFAEGTLCWEPWGDVVPAVTSDDLPPGYTGQALTWTFPAGLDDPWDVGVEHTDLNLTAGQWYQVGLWIKADQAAGHPFNVAVHSWPEDNTTVHYETVAAYDGWRRYERAFYSHDARVARLQLQLATPSAATVSIAGVSMSALGGAACERSGGDLVSNGSFDAGLACWEVSSALGHTGSFRLQEVAGGASGAAPSLVVDHLGVSGFDSWETSLRQHGLSATAGRMYELRFWARAAEARHIVAIANDTGLELHDPYLIFAPFIGTVWEEVVLTFDAPFTTSDLSLEFNLDEYSEAAVELDGVRITDIGAAPCTHDANATDLIRNGGFDDGLACWQVAGYPHDRGIYTLSDDAPPEQAPSLKVEPLGADANQEWLTKAIYPRMTIKAGHAYELRFDAKSDRVRTVTAHVHRVIEPNADVRYYDPTLSTEWATYSQIFTASENTSDVWLEFKFTREEGPVWIDNVSLQDLGFPR